jgi:hypothetical protein
VVEIIGIAGVCIVVCLGELTRRTVLGGHFEHEVAESRSIPHWRLLRSEAELSEALSRALESERTTLEQHARISERYQGMYDAQFAGEPAEPRENARTMDVSVRCQTMGGAGDRRAEAIPREGPDKTSGRLAAEPEREGRRGDRRAAQTVISPGRRPVGTGPASGRRR